MTSSRFAQAHDLADKRRALDTVTAQLRIDAAGPAAAARTAAAHQRMAEAGRQPGWSLELNPTPAMLEQMGVDPVTYRAQLAARAVTPTLDPELVAMRQAAAASFAGPVRPGRGAPDRHHTPRAGTETPAVGRGPDRGYGR